MHAIWAGLVTFILAVLLLFVVKPLLLRHADRHRARRLAREKAEHVGSGEN